MTTIIPSNETHMDYVQQTSNVKPHTNKLKIDKVKKRMVELLSNSTAHSIPNIISASNGYVRSMWLAFFMISIGCCGFFTIDSIADYLSFNTVTAIGVYSEQQSEFPTVSFCSYPELNSSISDIIMSATFEKVEISNFSSVFRQYTDPVYGNCFRFNSGNNIDNESIAFLNSTKTGFSDSLTISFNLKIPKNYDFIEILLHIHNHTSPPYDMENDVYWFR